MSDNFRLDRITRLLEELRYEITRGMMDREIDETLEYMFYVPVSSSLPDGAVMCQLRTRPVLLREIDIRASTFNPTLRVIKGGKS